MHFPPPPLLHPEKTPPWDTRGPGVGTAASSTPSERVARYSGFRPEVQGLRAVAVLLVVVYHVFVGRVSGGVDIFLFISAFLLTGTFTRRLGRGGPLQIPRYWVHTFKRLVPPSTAVILLVIAATFALLPATRWRAELTQAITSALYVQNWWLAHESVDYYAQDHAGAGLLQHYWSMSIQGQVYILWPLLFLLALPMVRRLGMGMRPVLLVIFGAVTIVSFAWSVHITATDQAVAYFDTRARLWEFSAGALLALVLPLLEERWGIDRRSSESADPQVAAVAAGSHRVARAVAGWAGIAAILACGWVVDVRGAFPGYVALWPLLAAALVIVAGRTALPWSADRVLSRGVLPWIGSVSYALYLVHWPALVLALSLTGTSHLGALAGAGVIVVSLALAWVLTRVVDTPVRRSVWLEACWWRGATVIAVCLALVVGTALISLGRLDAREQEAHAREAAPSMGAEVIGTDGSTPEPSSAGTASASPTAEPVPLLADLPHNWFSLPGRCRGDLAATGELADICGQSGDGSGPLLVIVGDSRDEQYAPSLVSTATSHGWTVVTLLRGGCPYASGPGVPAECTAHTRQVSQYLARHRPAAVMMSLTRIGADRTEETMPGTDALIRPLLAAGTNVIGYRDMPRLRANPVTCLERADDPETCAEDVSAQYTDPAPYPASARTAATAAPGRGRVLRVDVTQRICPHRRCTPVIGGVHVWMDPAHISAVYAGTLAPSVADQLSAQGFSWAARS